jgi:hypothetical protein
MDIWRADSCPAPESLLLLGVKAPCVPLLIKIVSGEFTARHSALGIMRSRYKSASSYPNWPKTTIESSLFEAAKTNAPY